MNNELVTLNDYINNHAVNTNKLLTKFKYFNLNKNEFKIFSTCYLLHVKNFIPSLCYMMSKAPDYKVVSFLGKHLYEESGSGIENENHLFLYYQFLESLNINLNTIKFDKKLTEISNKLLKITREDSFFTSFGAIGLAGETIAPTLFNPIIKYIRKSDLSIETKYFDIHCCCDITHSKSFFHFANENYIDKNILNDIQDGVKIYLENIESFWDRIDYIITGV